MKRINVQQPKKWIIVGVSAGIVGLLIGGYTFASSNQWRAMELNSAKQLMAIKQMAQKTFDSSSDRATRQSAITQLATMTSNDICKKGWWFGWQSDLISNAQRAHNSCQATVKKATRVTEAAAVADSYLNDEKKLIRTLNQLTIETKTLTEKNWNKTVTRVKAAKTQLRSLKFSGEIQPTLAEAVKRVTALNVAWEKVIDTHEKKDKSAYLNAVDALDLAYVNLGSITDVSNAQVEKYVKILKSTTDNL